jgi:hypothetical protein
LLLTGLYYGIFKKLILFREAVFLYAVGLTALCWTFLVYIFTDGSDIYPMARTLRAFISTVIGSALIFTLIRRFNYSEKELLLCICLVLSINAAAVFLQILVPETQQLFSRIWGFDKKFLSFRAFGLTAGYDTAGYLNVIGLVTAVLLKIKTSNSKYNYLMVVFFLSTLLTSRSSVALLLFTSITILLYSIYKFNLKKRYLFVPFILIFIVVRYLVIPIFMSTLGGGSNLNNTLLLEIATNYSSSDIEETYSALWYFPEGLNLLIGVGQNIASDVGYVILIWMSGLVMLFLALFFYVIPILYVYFQRRSIIHSYVYLLLTFVTFVILIGNLKNLYFFTRSYHELYITLITAYFALMNKGNVTKIFFLKSQR